MIGKNYALHNRIVIQACIIAANLNRTDLAERVRHLADNSHSEEVRKTAGLTLNILNKRSELL